MQSFQSFFSRHANEYAHSEGRMHGKDLDLLIDMLNLKKSYKVLDVGTGPGFVAFAISDKVAVSVGLDITGHMLEIAARKTVDDDVHNVIFVSGDAMDMPFPNEIFDVVTCRRAAHHFQSRSKFLGEALRVLKKGGKLGITDILKPINDKKGMLDKIERIRDSTYTGCDSLDGWFKLLKDNAFQVDNFKTFVIRETIESWLFPIKKENIAGRRIMKEITQNIGYFQQVFNYDKTANSFDKSRMVIIADKPA